MSQRLWAAEQTQAIALQSVLFRGDFDANTLPTVDGSSTKVQHTIAPASRAFKLSAKNIVVTEAPIMFPPEGPRHCNVGSDAVVDASRMIKVFGLAPTSPGPL